MSLRAPRSVGRRDPAIYADPTQHDDRLIALRAYRTGCRCDHCKKHITAERRSWRDRHGSYQTSPERKREQNRAYWYGMEPGQYDAMLTAQEGKCMICDRDCGAELVVDHCHNTGRIRGLLCRRCNTMIGIGGDSVEMLTAAIRYLTGPARETRDDA